MSNCMFCYENVEDEAYHPECSERFFGVRKAPVLELNSHLLKKIAEETVDMRISVTGVQPKLSVTLEGNVQAGRLTIVGLWGEYILKPQHDAYAQMPEVEDLTMHLAAIFKIPTCEHALLRTTEGQLVYLAKRFDRKGGRKIHSEDLCQLSEFQTENKYKGSYESAGKLISKYCTNTGLDALNYFELVLFSYLTGNNDMHLKNFSVLHSNDAIVLSPTYDLLNVNLVNPQDDEEMALTLNGKKKRLKLSDFAALANSLKIPEQAYKNSIKKFSKENERVAQLIHRSFLANDAKEQYLNIWYRKQSIFG